MRNVKPRPRTQAGVNAEEKRAWATFYGRVRRDPLLAAELIKQLDQDPELKRALLALYLCSKESLRTHQQRHARNQHIACAIRWLLQRLIALPIRWLADRAHRGTDIALATLPREALGETKNPQRPQIPG